jgi:PAS domain S-box-containing protein
MKNRWSVRTYLWLLAAAVALPWAGVLAFSIADDARHDDRQVRDTTRSLAQLVASQTQQFLSETERLAGKLALRPAINAMDPKKRDPVFDQFLEWHPQFANLVVCDTAGRVIHSASAAPADKPLATVRAQWVEAVVRQGAFTVGKPIMGQVTRRWVCVLGYPIRGRTGQVVGALGMSVDLARFHDAASLVSLPANSVIMIVDREGTVIMRSLEAQKYAGANVRGSEVLNVGVSSAEGEKIMRGLDREQRIYGFVTIPKVGWRVYVGMPTKAAFASVRAIAWRASLLGAVLVVLIVALVLVLGRLINRPVRALYEAVTAAAEGDTGRPAPTSGPRELAAVAVEFNRMLAIRQAKESEIQRLNQELEQRVHERTKELETANAELQREVVQRKRVEAALRVHQQELQDYIDSMSTLNAKVALDGTLLMVNKSAQQASGLPLDILMKTNFLEGQWWAFDPQVQARVREAFAKACAGAEVHYDEKLFVFGKVIDINFSLVPVRDGDGGVAYVVAEGRDITPLKGAEAALAERTAQLEAANKELEAFAYSVSHDLRAPLRGIAGFSSALVEDCAESLDESGKEHVKRIRRSVDRMAQLIDDLLKLSRISRSDLRCGTVDLSAQASAIAVELKSASPDRAVTFDIQQGLVARGDEQLLRVVLDNLLRNAWKFSRKRDSARIEFGATRVEGQTAFFVRDNGAGFNMAYQQKLFGPFQRLHSAEEYEGTGIGLATVQRIVQRHGGRAWGEGRVGEGATFYFSMPA